MKQVWQAKNGDIFDSEEECRDFEEKFYGATGVKYIVDDKFVVPRDIEEEEKIMDATQYIFVPKEVFPEAVERLQERGFSCPKIVLRKWQWKRVGSLQKVTYSPMQKYAIVT